MKQILCLLLVVLAPRFGRAQDVIADSIEDWSFEGAQGENGWEYGYRNFTQDGGGQDYSAKRDFIPFLNDESGDLSSENHWSGSYWSLSTVPFAAAPWTFLTRTESHPNGESSDPEEEHWPIRRFTAQDIDCIMPVTITWHTAAAPPPPPFRETGGHTGALYINGKLADEVTVGPDDTNGFYREYYHNLIPGDIIDLAMTPLGTDNRRSDSRDTVVSWMLIEAGAPGNAEQPDGTPFTVLEDEDEDCLPDQWELSFVDALELLSGGEDYDNDGVTDLAEFLASSSPIDGRSISPIIAVTGGEVALAWPSREGDSYTIEQSVDLVEWHTLRENIVHAPDGLAVQIARPEGFSAWYLRIISIPSR